MAGVIEIGEAFVGEGPEAAHLNTVLGDRDGPVGTAWATALATPRAGHAAFVTIVRPGLAVKPLTLFVNKAPLQGGEHSRLTWGAAQAGLASGVLEAVASGTIDEGEVDRLVLIAAVWVDPRVADEELVYDNNRRAAPLALAAGHAGAPALGDLLAVRHEPVNPFFRSV
jgi:5,6,7,8-tetrahydromethanopterin hydro-lyase